MEAKKDSHKPKIEALVVEKADNSDAEEDESVRNNWYFVIVF